MKRMYTSAGKVYDSQQTRECMLVTCNAGAEHLPLLRLGSVLVAEATRVTLRPQSDSPCAPADEPDEDLLVRLTPATQPAPPPPRPLKRQQTLPVLARGTQSRSQ